MSSDKLNQAVAHKMDTLQDNPEAHDDQQRAASGSAIPDEQVDGTCQKPRPTMEASNNEMMQGKKKKRSSGKKSAAKRGPTALPPSRGTGFEEYFADPPLTAQEAAEERLEIYPPDLPFEERMQQCIQRFRARRRLQADTVLFFDEYLFLGGVDNATKPFTGISPQELKAMTPAERREATAGDPNHNDERFYNGAEDKWVVDFAGVAAGFFSVTMPDLTGLEEEDTKPALGVVENFLKYVLHHDVCPEYKHSVEEALRVCNLAREEWPIVTGLRVAMPGAFNEAAVELFCPGFELPWKSTPQEGKLDPSVTFYSELALVDECKNLFTQFRSRETQPKAAREFECTVRVEKIQMPSEEIVKRLRSITVEGRADVISAVGKVKTSLSTIKDGWDHPKLPTPFREPELELYFEHEILAKMRVGMKMTLTVVELDTGFRFVKVLHALVPTFYTFLPQELMRHYKPPQDNERPAQSVHDQPGYQPQQEPREN